jgi:hypothetical protein
MSPEILDGAAEVARELRDLATAIEGFAAQATEDAALAIRVNNYLPEALAIIEAHARAMLLGLVIGLPRSTPVR